MFFPSFPHWIGGNLLNVYEDCGYRLMGECYSLMGPTFFGM